MVVALVPVGNSRRLKNKHFLDFCGRRIIDAVVENLNSSGLFSRVVIYSYRYFNIDGAEIIIDGKMDGVLPLIMDAMERYRENVFVLGGDMPLADSKSISPLLTYPDNLSVIPTWANGYMEPLHALYSITAHSKTKEKSLQKFIMGIPRIHYPAEKLPPEAFFNVNTPEDYRRLVDVCHGNL